MLPQGSRRIFSLVLAILIVVLAGLFDAPASAATMSVPSKLILDVRETAGVARSGEVVRSGVPLPRSLNVLGTGGLAVVDAAGTPVPAEFEVTARWNAGKSDAAAPIQWLLVTFPATVGANQTATYRLVTDGSAANPAPATQISLTQSGNAITVNTGAAVFHLGANPGALFDEVDLANGTKLIGGGALSLQTGGATYGHSTTRAVIIEHQGPLTAIVVVKGAYDVPAIGGGQVSTRRRYVFTAGSPTAVVRHVANWEGSLACEGCIVTSAGAPNGVRIDKAEDDLQVSLGGTPTVTAIGNFSAPAVSGAVAAGQSAWVRQQLRASRTAPQVYDVNVAGAAATGAKADGALLAASGPAGTVAVALNHMHRYEPQALRMLPTGHLAIDVVDDKAWLANHQGLFATLAVTAAAGAPSRDSLNRTTWAPLNRPLHAWPEPQWLASSDAVDDFPVGPLPADLASYDTVVSGVLGRTVSKIDSIGLNGLMTFGVYPRYWGEAGYDGEVDCGAGADPTPNEHWDDTFWCGAWTDYHNTTSTAQVWAMRTGDVEWLDEIAFPGALRTLHTQIMQCSPTTAWFYCGQSPTGYGAYRTDFNSSHAYFENLILYYWLTGDQTVIDIVQRGADSMRRWECPQRGPNPVVTPHGPDGPACAADYPINDPNATLTGRVGEQWQYIFRFMGLASDDASFLDDFRLNFARMITQLYVAPVKNGVTYGFWGGPSLMPSSTAANTDLTDSQWTIGMYDMHYLSRYQRDSGDAPLGIPALKPSQVVASIAHTYKDYDAVVYGDGTVSGLWARLLQYTWSGPRLGGTLGTVAESDRELYDPEKTGAAEVLISAGQQQGDASLVDFGRKLTVYMLADAAKENVPLGKLMGQDLSRIHPAVALLANGSGSTPAPPPPPSAPGALTAQAASSSAINLSWQDNSTDEDSFRVEQFVNGAYQEIKSLAAGTTAVQVGGLAASAAYSFRVRAANAGGYSAYSNIATTTTQAVPVPPAAPTALTAQAASTSAINLSWRDNSANEDSFHVQQLVNGAYQEVQILGPNVTSVQIGGLAAATTYSFRVVAANAVGYSAYSNVASATTAAPAPPPSPVPAAPTGLTAKGGTVAGTIQLTWTDNASNESSFRIEELTGGAYKEVYAVGANVTTALITGLNPGTSYSFRVRAANSSGYSAYSNVATGTSTPGTPPPTAPQITSATALGGGAVQVRWRDNSSTEVQFVVESSLNGSTFQTAATVAANSTTARITGLAKGKRYFRVKAVDALGQASYSTVMMVNVR
ncbi:MAG TPA: fibronectin type III domain-containing protein [Thermoanaerobaculia bacterium]|nr:fibronectin type III domain-containing protein [Thermoanaerobaculia bacterium]